MQIAVRPFLLAGIAFTGAAAVALTPIKPSLPDIQMPAISTPALELAAVPSYLEWVQQRTEADTKNVPSWQQILDPDFDGALSAAIELGTYLFQHFLPADLIINDVESSLATQTPAAPSPLEFINSVEAMLTDPTFLPTIVNDIVQVVQVVATNTVEPVIDLVLRMTFTTLYRASSVMKATFQDVPEIAFSVISAGGKIFQSAATGISSIVTAALTDPLSILAAATDGVMQFGAVIADEAIKIIDSIDKFRRDIEAALVSLPPTPPSTNGVANANVEPPSPAAALAPTASTKNDDATKTDDESSTDGQSPEPSGIAAKPSTGSFKSDALRPGPSDPEEAPSNPAEAAADLSSAPPVLTTDSAPTASTNAGSANDSARKSTSTQKSADSAAGGKSGVKAGPKHRAANR